MGRQGKLGGGRQDGLLGFPKGALLTDGTRSLRIARNGSTLGKSIGEAFLREVEQGR